VVLVLHEALGVHEYVADTFRPIAKAGHLAIAPELFARQGDPSSHVEIAKLLAEVVSKVRDKQVLNDLDGVVKWAGENGGYLEKVGITGFCWGGPSLRFALNKARMSKPRLPGAGACLGADAQTSR
jgi:carboxymethylenebutenolidase